MILDAVRRRASFNVVHLGTMFKADVFLAKADPWGRAEIPANLPSSMPDRRQ